MNWPFVTRRYAEYLEAQVVELKEQNAGLIRTAYAARGFGDPYAGAVPRPANLRPIGRKQAAQLITEMEEKERAVATSASN